VANTSQFFRSEHAAHVRTRCAHENPAKDTAAACQIQRHAWKPQLRDSKRLKHTEHREKVVPLSVIAMRFSPLLPSMTLNVANMSIALMMLHGDIAKQRVHDFLVPRIMTRTAAADILAPHQGLHRVPYPADVDGKTTSKPPGTQREI